MKSETRVYLVPLEDEHIYHYMSFSDDPELITTMGWRPFGPNERERFIKFSQVLTLPNLVSDKAIVSSIVSVAGDKAMS